jgi:hypothetical protein
MKMYVVNATKHNHNFAYIVTERTGITIQTIPMGTQLCLTGDLTQENIDSIIAQHAKYGFPSVDEIESKNAVFSGIFYSINKAASEEKIRRAMFRVQNQLVYEGKEMRKQAAIALNNQIEDDILGDSSGIKLKSLEMTVEEIAPKGGLAEGQELMAEGIRVEKEPSREPISPPRGGRGRR